MQFIDLCQSYPVESFAAGDRLIQEDEAADRLFVLKSGAVRVSKAGITIAERVPPGALFGEMSALLGMPYTADVTAVEPCEAHVIEDAQSFLTADPAVALAVARLLAQRLYNANRFVTGQAAAHPGEAGADALWGLIYQQAGSA